LETKKKQGANAYKYLSACSQSPAQGGPGNRPTKKSFARPVRSLFLPPRTRFVGFSGVIFFFLTGVGVSSKYVDLETETIFFDVQTPENSPFQVSSLDNGDSCSKLKDVFINFM
jgi:hypothetical protein